MSDDEKIVGIYGGSVVADPQGLPDQLYSAERLLEIAPKDLHRMVIVGEDSEGNLHVSSTHHSGFVSLLLGKAQHLVHSRYELKQ